MSHKPKDDLSVLQLFAILLGGGAAICGVLAIIFAAALIPAAAGQFLVYAFWSGIGAAICIFVNATTKRKP